MKAEAVKLWLDERLALDAAAEIARKKEIPLHLQSVWYYFGGIE